MASAVSQDSSAVAASPRTYTGLTPTQQKVLAVALVIFAICCSAALVIALPPLAALASPILAIGVGCATGAAVIASVFGSYYLIKDAKDFEGKRRAAILAMKVNWSEY